jgi:RNA polymerase sigma-70 factor (ECF subfamily)
VKDEFETHRPLLFAIAYRMLGSVAEAEDVVQETWLRLRAAPVDEVRTPQAYLRTVVTRLCLDRLKSAQVRREQYVGPWLPEPLPTAAPTEAPDTALDESLSLAFLVLLESLTPAERAVFLLHEVFDHEHAEIARILGREEAACRQLLHRARTRIAAGRPRFEPSREAHTRLLGAFAMACAQGDLQGLTRLLADDVTLWSDGGGRVSAARRPLHGPDHVARFLLGIARKGGANGSAEPVEVNGAPALLLRQGGAVIGVLSLECDQDVVRGVRVMLNPDKLTRWLHD